ncbi:hypothetical protein U9M48_040716 [Paspalum notatum var. saurae]|uniref:Uncharacterized protein n=1 Tax=Paspalum notatum var. saurae TaxID=547442 RepID=A0AAQ3UP18_PASNO
MALPMATAPCSLVQQDTDVNTYELFDEMFGPRAAAKRHPLRASVAVLKLFDVVPQRGQHHGESFWSARAVPLLPTKCPRSLLHSAKVGGCSDH